MRRKKINQATVGKDHSSSSVFNFKNKEGHIMAVFRCRNLSILFFLFILAAPNTLLAAYIPNGDGTVTDTRTRLVWQQDDDAEGAGAMSWKSALAYCENLSLAGKDDWRLPNRIEIDSIVDNTRSNPAIDPAFSALSMKYWTSTTYAPSPSSAWFSAFNYGSTDYHGNSKTDLLYVRCVRSQKSSLDDGLIAYFPFEGDAQDFSGYDNDGNTVNDPTYVSGKYGKAIELNGVDQYVRVPNSDSLNPDQITVSMWYKLDSLPASFAALIQKYADGADDDVTWQIIFDTTGDGKLNSGLVTTDKGSSLSFPTLSSVNEWVHVALTFDGSTYSIYKNGEKKASVSQSGTVKKSNYDISIGRGKPISGRWIDGLIDDVRIYSRALSAAEIQQLSSASVALPWVTTKSITNVATTTASSGGVVTFDGGSTVTARGVCWSTSPYPTINDSKTLDGTGTGAFTSTMSGLAPDTKYYVRAYAQNSEGVAYGSQLILSTQEEKEGQKPTVVTYRVTKITKKTAKSGGDVTDQGAASVSAKGICISTQEIGADQDPQNLSGCSSKGAGLGSFTHTFNQLTPGARYYVRAFATNAYGWSYGEQHEFVALKTANKKIPVAKAGPAQHVSPGQTVRLNGKGSFDKDGFITDYFWKEINGSSLKIIHPSNVEAFFLAPGNEGRYAVELQVTDNDGLISTDQCIVNVASSKKPPVAVSGPNQTGKVHSQVTLYGQNSFDHDGTIVSYLWEQLSGDIVALSSATAAMPTFTPTSNGVRTFKLTVTDNDGLVGTAVTCVNTFENKKPPIAIAYAYIPEAGSAAIELSRIQATTSVNLDGSNSVGRDGASIASYSWEQILGAPVSISNPTDSQTSFNAAEAGAYTFKLTVVDSNGLEASDIARINVLDNNQAPTANAGSNRNVGLNTPASLDGTDSSDPDGSIATFEWEQVMGTPVTLNNPNSAQPSFTTPDSVTGLMFQLTVTDDDGATDIDTVIINATDGTPPNANASGRNNGNVVTLNGCSSSGDGLSYAWRQTGGPNISLNDPETCSPSFTPSSGTSVAGSATASESLDLAKPMTESSTYSFELIITDTDGLMSSSTTGISIVSGSALNHIIYRNERSGAYAFLKLNDNGTMKNTSLNDGMGLISDWNALRAFNFESVMQNSAGDTQIIISNADGSRYGWLRLNSNGTLANLTNNDGVAWMHSSALNMSNWSLIGIQDNGSHDEGLNHLIFQSKGTGDLGFMKLNANGTIKNETRNDGFGRINFGLNFSLGAATDWRYVDIQENADATGADRLLMTNQVLGLSIYLKLNSNGTLANTTANDGYGVLTPRPIANYIPVALDNLTNSGVIFKNASGGRLSMAYLKMNSNGTLQNLTRGSGWDVLQDTFDLSGFDVFGFTTINGENAMLLRNTSGGRVGWFKLNANGTAKNTSANNGMAWVGPDYSSAGWRAVSMDPTSY